MLQRAGRWMENLEGCVEDDYDEGDRANETRPNQDDSDEGYEILERSKRTVAIPQFFVK